MEHNLKIESQILKSVILISIIFNLLEYLYASGLRNILQLHWLILGN